MPKLAVPLMVHRVRIHTVTGAIMHILRFYNDDIFRFQPLPDLRPQPVVSDDLRGGFLLMLWDFIVDLWWFRLSALGMPDL